MFKVFKITELGKTLVPISLGCERYRVAFIKQSWDVLSDFASSIKESLLIEKPRICLSFRPIGFVLFAVVIDEGINISLHFS